MCHNVLLLFPVNKHLYLRHMTETKCVCVCGGQTPTRFRLMAINVIIATLCDSEWTLIALGKLREKSRQEIKLEISSTCPSHPCSKNDMICHDALLWKWRNRYMTSCWQRNELPPENNPSRRSSSSNARSPDWADNRPATAQYHVREREREEVRVGMRWPPTRHPTL